MQPEIPLSAAREMMDNLYLMYNKREYIHPDPLEFLYQYDNVRDREVVGMIASSLAYGKVFQILAGVKSVLRRMESSPYHFLKDAPYSLLVDTFCDFQYRFTTGEELVAMLFGIKKIIEKYGSLRECFVSKFRQDDDTIERTLALFVNEIREHASDNRYNSLLPCPAKGSACKRLNLFLRWMIRKDDVDPGGWNDIPASKLIVPLDTHMNRLCLMCRITQRKQASMKTANEITGYFRRIFPEDPVRYDFALTRLGIRKDTDRSLFLKAWG
ncbi:MAG: TIGR02757 family protein, partial [Deltaproteobacteria bacterium]|nr:TIGR02757 family protein [Deltaproteobacteria bacterium]